MTQILNNISYTRLYRWTMGWFTFTTLILVFLLSACQEEYDAEVSNGELISISASADALVLEQVDYSNSAITFNWTTGSNQGTGASISYVFEIDKAGNDFASAKVYDFGKQVYEKSLTVEDLNDMVTELWGVLPGESLNLEARVTAKVADESVEDDVSSVVSFSVQTYKPVSESLYIVGDATSAGWNIADAIEMTGDDEEPWIFTYEGQLSPGNFKFPVSTDECWCQDFYTQNPDDAELMVYNEGGSGDDVQWEVLEGSPYVVTVNLLDLTISIEKQVGPAYTELYIVGDASLSGWNIGSPEAFTQDADDPFVFTYEGPLNTGNLKFSTYQGDWCDGDWFVASQDNQTLDATDYVINQGCNGNDCKWVVTDETAGRYLITINLFDNTVKFEKVMLYLIGDGGPNGWNIGTPEPFTYSNGVYTFNGELGADNAEGEFKISKFKGDWCNGDWINAATESQSLSNTSYIITHGCDGPDNKWKLSSGDAGTYEITIDLDNEVMAITKQ
ncbi:SusF/SusE family outer membrane protein [Plebeiibacterium sediminum]|uniref:SusF/SusE family outer membrane protein n=1 Tax=Plebeiibacterium sediminum TaxID=2992112 RepID=A0AAE3M8Z8_9BACT|nr:SusF/SusE family outer membrane protein [Plebeiobacterium sediminum]MCW3789278.1 SusF/SusE family outer membrane protein [Plebeiobacterium sediminum]